MADFAPASHSSPQRGFQVLLLAAAASLAEATPPGDPGQMPISPPASAAGRPRLGAGPRPLTLADKMALGDPSEITELLVLENLLTIESFEHPLLQEMEYYALLGSCARTMEQVQTGKRSFLLKDQAAKQFRDVLFHELTSDRTLYEVKRLAQQWASYCRDRTHQQLSKRNGFSNPLFNAIVGQTLGPRAPQEISRATTNLKRRYDLILAYQARSWEEADFKARALGFLEAKLGGMLAEGRSASPVSASAPGLPDARPLPAGCSRAEVDRFLAQGRRFRHADYAPLAEVDWAFAKDPSVRKRRIPWAKASPAKLPAPARVHGPEPHPLTDRYPDLTGLLSAQAIAALKAQAPPAQEYLCETVATWLIEPPGQGLDQEPGAPDPDASAMLLALMGY